MATDDRGRMQNAELNAILEPSGDQRPHWGLVQL